MNTALYASFFSYAFVMSVTPGPNNLMLMSSGALFGVRATVRHWLGINLGFSLMLFCAVFGLGEVVDEFPWTLLIVRGVGTIWLAWMVWQFLQAAFRPTEVTRGSISSASRPFGVLEAAMFQWVNPKALLMTISAASAYINLMDTAIDRAAIMVGTFLLTGMPCGFLWMISGGTMRRFLTQPRSARILNLVIASILALTIGLVLSG